MGFPRKFKRLIETESHQVVHPDYVLVTWAVCACTGGACGWGAWMLEAAFQCEKADHPLPSKSDQVCPNCGGDLFRTGVTDKLVYSGPFVDNSEYELAPIEWDDTE